MEFTEEWIQLVTVWKMAFNAGDCELWNFRFERNPNTTAEKNGEWKLWCNFIWKVQREKNCVARPMAKHWTNRDTGWRLLIKWMDFFEWMIRRHTLFRKLLAVCCALMFQTEIPKNRPNNNNRTSFCCWMTASRIHWTFRATCIHYVILHIWLIVCGAVALTFSFGSQ